MKKYKYIFIGSEPRIFPTLGVELKKGETIDSDVPLSSDLLQEVTESIEQPKQKGE